MASMEKLSQNVGKGGHSETRKSPSKTWTQNIFFSILIFFCFRLFSAFLLRPKPTRILLGNIFSFINLSSLLVIFLNGTSFCRVRL